MEGSFEFGGGIGDIVSKFGLYAMGNVKMKFEI